MGMIIFKSNERGFTTGKFQDRYKQECSIQDSSIATEACIWLGVDNTGQLIEGPSGNKNETVNCRMHLTVDMVKELIPILQAFVATGFLPNKAMTSSNEYKFVFGSPVIPVPDGYTLLEAYTGKDELIVCGNPPDEDGSEDVCQHNCDAMGCSSVNHVVYRGHIGSADDRFEFFKFLNKFNDVK